MSARIRIPSGSIKEKNNNKKGNTKKKREKIKAPEKSWRIE
jgi:hypothetical protein